MATKTIPKTSDREALEKRLRKKFQRVIDSQDQEAMAVVEPLLDILIRRLQKPKKGDAE